MIMNKFFSVLMCCSLLTACFEIPMEETAIAPKGTHVEALSAKQVLQENSAESLQFKPIENSRIRFFDAQGRLVDKPVNNGFYRKVLGMTPHNHLVLQDFYQNSDKPYTLPFVAVSNPQLKIFRGAGIHDSRTVWLNTDGSIMRVSEFRNGKALGETWFYHRNKPIAYIKLLTSTTPKTESPTNLANITGSQKSQKNNKINKQYAISTTEENGFEQLSKGAALMHFFYPNGGLMAEIETDGNHKHKVTLYYPNSVTMLQIEDDGIQSMRTAWDVHGQKIAPADVAVEADVLGLRIEYGLNLMGRDKSSLADLLLSQ